MDGYLENCVFDPDEADGCFVVYDIVSANKRTSKRLADHAAWAPWPEVFGYIGATSAIERVEEQREALSELLTKSWLARCNLAILAKRMQNADHQRQALAAVSVIDALSERLSKASDVNLDTAS